MTTANLTIVDNETVIQYLSVGESDFVFPFPILSSDELKVSVNQAEKMISVDYTVSGVGDAAGGTVSFLTPTTAGQQITLWVQLPIKRLTGFALGASTLLPEALNSEFVRQVRVDQMLRRDIGRALRVHIDDPQSGQDLQLPTASVRAGKFLRFADTNGNPEVATGLDQDQVLSQSVIGGFLYGVQTPAESSAGITPSNVAYPERNLLRYAGILADGVTDCTNAILTVCNAMGGKFLLPHNVLYDRPALIAGLDTDVVIFDESVINDFRSAGETTKHVGIVSSDEAVSDTHWAVDSGHHAIITLNNFGTAGSTSAAQRKATLLWAAGQFALGTAAKRGFRGAALLQFTQAPGDTIWTLNLRSLAPWNAIAGQYEEWAQGQTIVGVGNYRVYGDNHYVSATSGTHITGANPPVHTTGTVSDGVVDWTWVDSSDRSLLTLDQHGRWLLGSGAFGATWRHKVSPTDPNGTYAFEGEAKGASAVAQLKLIPTGAGSAASPQPFIRAQDGVGLRVMKSDSSTDLARFSDTGGLAVKQLELLSGVAADADTTPSVAGVSTLYLSNTGATAITALDDGVDDQLVVVVATNGNSTINSSATLLLTGSANQALTAWSSITFKKIPAAISNRWVEIARSLK